MTARTRTNPWVADEQVMAADLNDTFAVANGVITAVADEAIAQNDSVIISDGTQVFTIFDKAVTNTTNSAFGWAGQNYYATQVVTTGAIVVDTIKIGLLKTGSPSDNAVIAIQADSGGSPSGSDLATATIAGSALTTSIVVKTLALSGQVSMSASSTYWVVCRRSGALNGSNFYNVGSIGSSSGNKIWNGSSWSTVSENTEIILTRGTVSGHIIRSNSNTVGYNNHFGFAQQTVAYGANCVVQFGGICSNFSALTPNAPYYISQTNGGISTSPCGYPVGVAITSTTIAKGVYVRPQKKVVLSFRNTSGVQTIAHGFNGIPSKIAIKAKYFLNTTNWADSYGVWDGTTVATVWEWHSGGGSPTGGTDSANIVYISGFGGGPLSAVATWDGTNVYLTWTISGSISCNFTLEIDP